MTTPERSAKLQHGMTNWTTPDRRVVRRIKTTLDAMLEYGQITLQARTVADAFFMDVSRAMGACVSGSNGNSARMVAQTENGALGASYGPRYISNDILDATRIRKDIERMIPAGLRKAYDQMLAEETGIHYEKARTMTSYGNDWGFRQVQQARAVGKAQFRCVCEIIQHHYRR